MQLANATIQNKSFANIFLDFVIQHIDKKIENR